ncbi:P27 family phage terminase small subunit [Aeromonas sp. QDB03]|uniref:P27 family phage terminase small subunit n=1 Tax=Aeromonas sp. QDB03 TaxID=2989839 RepID=UPI0022E21358|nr:P27 family phage terminase small subunit [Aeromonas sp. QDB03]
MAARKTTNVPVMLFTLHPEVVPIYKKVLNVLKKQRIVNDSELPIIATYSNQVYLNQRAMMSMVTDGVVLYSVTQHGEVQKENPQCKVFNQTTIQIAKYADILGLSAKAMNDISNPDDKEDDEDDPLSNLIKKRGKK